MIEYHRTHGHQVRTPVFSQTHRVTADSERPPVRVESRSGTRTDTSSYKNWAILAIWGFVLFSFAALLFCLHIISLKCGTGRPF